jgi:GDP-D-mannose dehydratase
LSLLASDSWTLCGFRNSLQPRIAFKATTISIAEDRSVRAALESAHGNPLTLRLANTSAQVDWGHAADTVKAMWLMLQQPRPADYVIATGELHSVKDWLEEAFGMFNLDWREFVVEDRSLIVRDRPASVLCGDSSRLRSATGWHPEFDFRALVRDLVQGASLTQTGDVSNPQGAIK